MVHILFLHVLHAACPELAMGDDPKMFVKYHTIPSKRALKVKAHTNVESKSLKLLDIYKLFNRSCI